MKQMKLTELPRWATGIALPLLNLLSALLVAALVIPLLGESPVESMKIRKAWPTRCSTPVPSSSPALPCRSP